MMSLCSLHLNEVAKILVGAIQRIKIANSTENENSEHASEIPLDISANWSVTVDR